jgi:prophage antirepressor-like protein
MNSESAMSVSTLNETQVTVNETQSWMGFPLRFGRDENSDIWFVLKDVCAALDIKNPGNVAARLRRDHGDVSIHIVDAQNSRGQMRKTPIVHEDYVYSYIVSKSRKPEALKFCRWVGSVIRVVRKTGAYKISTTQKESLALERFKLDIELIKFAKATFTNDARMTHLLQEKVASLMMPGTSTQKLIGGSLPLTVSELMERKWAQSNVLKYRCKVGRFVAKKFRSIYGEPLTTNKLVNGHTTPVKVYSRKYHGVVEGWISEKMTEFNH